MKPWLREKGRRLNEKIKVPSPRMGLRGMILTPVGIIALLLVITFIVSFIPSSFPETPRLDGFPESPEASGKDEKPPVGYYTTESLIQTIDRIVNKRGGFLSNDVAPPFVLMDNIPAWETGALRQARDLALAMRNDITRSQSQSEEDANLAQAQVLLNNDWERWIFPSAEGKYNDAIERIRDYRRDLLDSETGRGDFYARADNLASALELMSKRLGSLSQNLAASVAQEQRDTALANDPSAEAAKTRLQLNVVRTPWMQIDNVFYQARGTTWAMLTYLKAFKRDFSRVLEDKNAEMSLDQIIRELETTRNPLYSPMVLNGYEFGLVANHSLTMSSYLTRANAGIIDLINLLRTG